MFNFANLKTKKDPLLQKNLEARMYDIWNLGVVINLKQNAKMWKKVPKGDYLEFSLKLNNLDPKKNAYSTLSKP